ncbi:hypothetical protein [Thermomonospora cellulosilytica]|uniref:Uncharacterized protein n=1 Tax=Thermomonospora cellulosilytica TaxID=1411118 RepID=A0A7W3R7W0_9ACTN|nr:hypothetical protein [Thermomonospora cellulosilytica]MBA9003077.1 hypothetical protein [Thermomonospora cellulosilytica]
MAHLEVLSRCLEQNGGIGISLMRNRCGPAVLKATYSHPFRPPEDIVCEREEGEWWSDGRAVAPADDPEEMVRATACDSWRGRV